MALIIFGHALTAPQLAEADPKPLIAALLLAPLLGAEKGTADSTGPFGDH